MTGRPGLAVRPACADDLPALARVMDLNDEPVGWPDLPDVGFPYLEHVLRHKRLRVAELEGTVVGIGGSGEAGRPDVRIVTDLFVDPGVHERGAGRALLEAVLDGARERMTFSSADERALGLYIRAGMRPWWPLLYLEVEPGGLGRHDAGVESRPADAAETAHWSRAWSRIDRLADFEHYASMPEATGFAVIDGGAVAAVAWARREQIRADGRWLSHASIAPDADPVRATFGVLRGAAGDDRLDAPVPGPHPAVRALLEQGVRIGGRDTFCASDPSLVDPERILPNPSFL
jgi:GNAT superfamily N-acetyltransferase